MRDFGMRAGCSLLAMLTLCACERFPESYPAPKQAPAFDDPAGWERIVHMTDVDARDHFVGDIIEPLAANWRWTGKRPTIRLNAPEHAQRKYRIEFVIPQQSFDVTGPVTLTFLVDGHTLDRKRYAAAGSYVFEKNVPPEWISGGEVTLGAEIDKVNAVKNGPTYGFLLIAIGLKRN